MVKSFLGKGWKFPLGTDRNGALDLSSYEKNIEDSIQIILGTAPGERMMRPNFGCGIHELVFAPNNSETASKVSYFVGDALQIWEPRIREVEVETHPDPERENRMMVKISYRVRATNSIFNMVYPFYLRKEEDL